MNWKLFEDMLPDSPVAFVPLVLVDSASKLYDGRVRRGVIAFKLFGCYDPNGYEYIQTVECVSRFTHWAIITLPEE